MAAPAADALFDPKRLAEQAHQLARSQATTSEKPPAGQVRATLRDVRDHLTDAYTTLNRASRTQELTPAAKWLLDNFYVVLDQLKTVRQAFPETFYRKLPRLQTGPFKGRPRVLELAHTLTTRTDNVVNDEHLLTFIQAFQEVDPLSLGELWGLEPMLRLVLLQHLDTLSLKVLESHRSYDEAERWAQRIADRAEQDPSEVVFELAEMAEQKSLDSAFVVRLAAKLQHHGPLAVPAQEWLEKRLQARGLTLHELMQHETQRLTQQQVSVANAITSLRWLNEAEWPRLVEHLSFVERTLRLDPAGVYAEMDFATRDRYRHLVEDLAAHAPASEFGVAERVLLMAEAAAGRLDGRTPEPLPEDAAALHTHIGYYLLDDGRRALEIELDYRPTLKERFLRFGYRNPTFGYLFPIFLLAVVFTVVAVVLSAEFTDREWMLALVAVVSFLPFLDFSVSLVNRVLTLMLPPVTIPKLDYEDTGIPEENATFVVVPTLITSPENARAQVDRLQVHYYANPDPNLAFALLTDFRDAPDATMPGDQATLDAALEAVAALNAKLDGTRFFVLHRERRWNAAEGTWMGWERKRGKLEEFNALLLKGRAADTSYADVSDAFFDRVAEQPPRYVITLDADTQLPPDAATDLVRTAAHPLNTPVYSPRYGRVVRGYGVLQPRIGITAQSGNLTPFSRLFSGAVGLDPYTRAVSDVYQDLFHVGIFTGKGLYDVHAFERALAGAVPENTVLSHDLLEGNHARTALVTDIELYDDYPSGYRTSAMRQHRWVRGDWQILPWLFPRVRVGEGRKRRNPVDLIGRWKIFDNLRRSITPPALLAFLLLGWIAFPGSPWAWSLVGIAILAFSIYAQFTTALLLRPTNVRPASYFKNVRKDLGQTAKQTALTVAFLAHQATFMLDAVGRTLWRMFISKRNRLEWVTAAQAEQMVDDSRASYYRAMWVSVGWGLLVLALVALREPAVLIAAVPFAALWIAAPYVAWYISTERREPPYVLTREDRRFLRRLTRRTWRFFDTYIRPEDRWLVPDNVQFEPSAKLARRTSPTNLGLALTSTVAALDFGYLSLPDLLHRMGEQLGSIRLLEKHEGHLYNWYATETGEVLHPHYVSFVDSGNLAGSLVIVKQALAALPSRPWFEPAAFDGLRDTIALAYEAARDDALADHANAFVEALDAFSALFRGEAPTHLRDQYATLHRLAPLAEAARAAVPEGDTPAHDDARYWTEQLATHLAAHRATFDRFAPWLAASGADLEVPDALAYPLPLGQWRAHLNAYGQALPGHAEALAATADALAHAAQLSTWADDLVQEMNFSLLYHTDRRLFSIGYNVDLGRLDPNAYDLMASEARLASYIAVAKGEVPPRHWFRLSRQLADLDGHRVLLSWSGTMFEYLMPPLFMETYDGTLLAETHANAVRAQQLWGAQNNKPWGISESAYYTLDIALNYQYRAFGVPGLGLKRGLGEDYVVSPYSTALALMVDPEAALENFRHLRDEGGYGEQGFYEAIDYTRTRIPSDVDKVVLRVFMAHHQGMSMMAFANVLHGGRMRNYFHADPLIKSCELFLQEKLPVTYETIEPPEEQTPHLEPVARDAVETRDTVVHYDARDLDAPSPHGLLLSNGTLTTLYTHAGGGFTRRGKVALTRWLPDRTTDDDGLHLYFRDLDHDHLWSHGHQPTRTPADRYDVWFHPNKVESARVNHWIESFVEVAVSPEDDVELRQITLTNYQDQPRRIELTTYAEVVLNAPEADAAHPAFSKLFVQTEYDMEHGALVATRRPRSPKDPRRWMFQALVRDTQGDHPWPPLSYETDRLRFIGRDRTLARPAALDSEAELSGTTGNVLDPVFAFRQVIELKPKEKRTLTLVTGSADDRQSVQTLAERYSYASTIERAFGLAQTYGEVELNHLDIRGDQAMRFQELAVSLLYGDPSLRADDAILLRNRKQQSGLWAYGISGDLPMLVARIASDQDVAFVQTLLHAHEYWRMKGIEIDLVILNDHPPSYAQELQNGVIQAVQSSPQRHLLNQKGGVFIRRTDQMAEDDVTLILTVARAVLTPDTPLFFDETEALEKQQDAADPLPPVRRYTPAAFHTEPAELPLEPLQFYNEYGGFSEDGTEYVIYSRGGRENARHTPLPWSNVLANEHFGCTVTEAGSGYTWSRNSRENRLTPWSNDPVMDPPGEAIYVRDEDAGVFWSPTPLPVPQDVRYETRHGFGHSTFRTELDGLAHETRVFVPTDDPVKVIRLTLRNDGNAPRRLTVFRYQEWVLGVRRDLMRPFVVTERDASGALFACNHYNHEFAGRVAFAHAYRAGSDTPARATADRTAFLGRNGAVSAPRAVATDAPLDGTTGPDLDPCAAFALDATLAPGETATFYFLLGEADDDTAARALVEKYADPDTVDAQADATSAFWRDLLTTIQIETPEPEFDVLVNGWLLYQDLACRIWGRSAFYQSGGAYGFRDQLQDVSALVYLRPDLTREQILLHAAHQFVQGDVLHWWHPPTGRGIRSNFSDDLLWLPYVTAYYIGATGDMSVLDEAVPFIEARPLEPGEDEAYLVPTPAGVSADVYEHCCRTLDRSLTKGRHGLPLMGSGDWNDGMNEVGAEGEGESIWLGFFIAFILDRFLPFCEQRGDTERVEAYTRYRAELGEALNDAGWDGQWYRRAYYDSGAPLGSSKNKEARIDAIAQGWSIMSGVAPPDRAEQALAAAEEHLIDDDARMIKLLTPPFDKTEHNPGYIKGYIPGVRENGGQYTHGVLWLIRAFAERGHGGRATELLEMISPVNHTRTKKRADIYKVEPYVITADVYSVPPHVGRGGWSWYTGSGGWTYRVALESLLGFRIEGGDTLVLDPRIPPGWTQFTITYRRPDGTTYRIVVDTPEGVESGVTSVEMDGAAGTVREGAARLPLVDDGRAHDIRVVMGG